MADLDRVTGDPASRDHRPLPSPLYAIIDPLDDPHRSVAEIARAVLAGGARLVQLRLKDRASRELLAAAAELRALTRAVRATLIVNDRVDVALAVGADGVHLGADDLPLAAARRLVGPALLLGRSTHDAAEAEAAVGAGADYVAFGPMFATASKVVSYPPQGLAALRAVRARVSVPLVAIGGITEDTAAGVRAAGADAVAIIGDIVRAPDITAKVRRLLAVLA